MGSLLHPLIDEASYFASIFGTAKPKEIAFPWLSLMLLRTPS